MREREAIRTAEAWLAEQDEAFRRAHIRKQVTDWELILTEARNFVAFAVVAILTVYAVLSIGGV